MPTGDGGRMPTMPEPAHEPIHVYQIAAAMDAPASAVEMLKPYGTDFRRAWERCSFGDFLLPFSVSFGVPFWLIVEAGVECIRMAIEPIGCSEAEDFLGTIELWICGEMCARALADEGNSLIKLGRIFEEKEKLPQAYSCKSVVAMGHAAISGNRCNEHPFQCALSDALAAASMARVEFSRTEGRRQSFYLNHFHRRLRQEYANITRTFIPFEVLAGAPLIQVSMEHDLQMPEA